ncbi:hypothetical protein O3P69_017061 [Scylla paramamosain]|uniref:Uncharacterized protein n=1 Tax=Scylla paramamosain TaxID=85552 RepID=A0AAW0TTN2_SCYPA
MPRDMEPRRSPRQRCCNATNSEVRIMSVNLRGFHTNLGELPHLMIRNHSADVVFVCEIFLDNRVPANYARLKGYSAWLRKDQTTQGGGVAFCYKESLSVRVVKPPMPAPRELELLMLKLQLIN